jgi:MoxR-like ATPase
MKIILLNWVYFMDADIKKLNDKAVKYSKKINEVIEESSNIVVGQKDVIRKVVLALIANGHVLLEGVPGLAKTLMIKTLSDIMHGSFVRLQFTPDLLPADIIGTKMYDHQSSKFFIEKGPIFHNFVLADEINRAPPKVQSALLESMQERQVSIHGKTYELKSPFLVLATQNPIENEGTYKLPEAQVDRFCMKLMVGYPTKNEEKEIIHRFTEGVKFCVKKLLSAKDIVDMQAFNSSVYCDEKIIDYVTSIIDATRNSDDYNIDYVGEDDNNVKFSDLIDCGASPRASIWLILLSKANAIFNGRGYVIPEDVKDVCYDVLRHRIILSYEAEAEGISSEDVIKCILDSIQSP